MPNCASSEVKNMSFTVYVITPKHYFLLKLFMTFINDLQSENLEPILELVVVCYSCPRLFSLNCVQCKSSPFEVIACCHPGGFNSLLHSKGILHLVVYIYIACGLWWIVVSLDQWLLSNISLLTVFNLLPRRR